MKPYGITTDDYGDTGCCPGHDFPQTRKWEAPTAAITGEGVPGS